MLWDEPKIFFLERRYFFSIILSEFLKNRVALHTVMLLAESYQVPLSGLLREQDREPDCAQTASACLLQCIEAMSGVLRRGATQPELKRCAAECIGWLEEILRPDWADGGQEDEA